MLQCSLALAGGFSGGKRNAPCGHRAFRLPGSYGASRP